MAVTPKTGKLVGASMLSEEDRKMSDVILISAGGQTIRLSLKGIRKTSRVTQGVILTKMKKEGDTVAKASIVREGEEDDE